jgi:hypothetical protein
MSRPNSRIVVEPESGDDEAAIAALHFAPPTHTAADRRPLSSRGCVARVG